MGVGRAAITSGQNLKQKYVIHTTCPHYSWYTKEMAEFLVQCCTLNILELTKGKPISSISLPLLGTGAFGFPVQTSAEVTVRNSLYWFALQTLATLDNLQAIRICIPDQSMFNKVAAWLKGAYQVDASSGQKINLKPLGQKQSAPPGGLPTGGEDVGTVDEAQKALLQQQLTEFNEAGNSVRQLMAATDCTHEMESLSDYIDLITHKICTHQDKEKMLLILKYFNSDSSGLILANLRQAARAIGGPGAEGPAFQIDGSKPDRQIQQLVEQAIFRRHQDGSINSEQYMRIMSEHTMVRNPNLQSGPNNEAQSQEHVKHMGTRNLNIVRTPLLGYENPKSLQEAFQEYTRFKSLKISDERSGMKEPGTPAYLVSSKWLKRYLKFILFEQFNEGRGESSIVIPADHFRSAHPGPISNKDDLIEEDKESLNLFGTGTLPGQKCEYIDHYVSVKANQQVDFVIFNEELWQFLFKRYGGLQIRRFYIKPKNEFYTQVETTLQPVSVQFLPCQEIIEGRAAGNNIKSWWTQVHENASLGFLKKRMVDHCNASRPSQQLQLSDARLWLFNINRYNKDRTLESSIECIRKVLRLYQGMPNQSRSGGGHVNIELNTGIKFPGQCLESVLNSTLSVGQIASRDATNIDIYVLEHRPNAQSSFLFRFDRSEQLITGTCEYCSKESIMKAICQCKDVKYCDEICQEKDRNYHMEKCRAQIENQLPGQTQKPMRLLNENSRKGLVGLQNMGNTCYLNSSIQCLSNTYELTHYFLLRKYEGLLNRGEQNPLGTNGQIIKAWGKLMDEMWRGSSSVIQPNMFKTILSQCNSTFEGYGQHDSQECINTILDFMSEDLYKQGKKPYVENTDTEGKSDEAASLEAWNKHLYRNESIICDIFHGQFKSTLICSKCERISITFDPFLMAQLPIPTIEYKKIDMFHMQYDIKGNPANYRFGVHVRQNDRIADLRKKVQKIYGFDASSYLITWVNDKRVICIYNSQQRVKDILDRKEGGFTMLFQIPKELAPKLPPLEQLRKDDSNNGIDHNWIKICINFFKQGFGFFNLPRFFWINKQWTLKQMHHEFFNYFKNLFVRWYDESVQETMSTQPPLYRHPDTNEILTHASLVEMFEKEPIEKQFKAFFPNLSEDNYLHELMRQDNSQSELPYQLRIENISSYGQPCHFCGSESCRTNCPLPYSSTLTVQDLLAKIGVDDNISFYNNGKGKQDLILNLVWQKDFTLDMQNHLSLVERGLRTDNKTDEDDTPSSQPLSIEDCFDEFKKPELLDEDNKWYCNKCKEHVQATKILEIYRAPPIFIINLKRFKHGKSRGFSMFGAGLGQKLENHIDFPLDGLDLSKHVISGNGIEVGGMIYDCYAVSNHMGKMGFGHYTAFCKNSLTNNWYEFNDTQVRQIQEDELHKTIVTSYAYNLFYRRRDWYEHNKTNGIDFDRLASKPDLAFLNNEQNK